MRKAQGYATITDPDLPLFEADTRTCAHCTRVDHIPSGADPADVGALCNGCGGLICRRCTMEAYRTGQCVTFQQKLAQSFARQDALRSYGLA